MRAALFVLLFVSTAVFAQQYNGFDLSNSAINKSDIVQGGPPRDSIPALVSPEYLNADAANFIKDDDIVLGLVFNGVAYAYPRYIMNWHEVVNDSGGFVITYCPLCGTGIAFSSQSTDKQRTFGVSGLLYNNDLIIYDHETESLWSQIEKKAISGPLVGEQLNQLRLEHTSWKVWKSKYPDSKILSEEQGYTRNYRHDPYTGYDTSSRVFFKTLRQTPSDYHTKEKVLGITLGGKSKAYPFKELRNNGKTTFVDSLSDVSYHVVWDPETPSATIVATDDKVLTPTVAFWFAWYNFHPDTLVFKAQK